MLEIKIWIDAAGNEATKTDSAFKELASSLRISFSLFIFISKKSFGHVVRLAGSQFPKQELNPGHSNESAES